MRQVVFDTETTGFEISAGNRVLEIGCVEIIERKITGRTWHCYINPERDSEEGAFAVHGLSSEFLADKPVFKDVAEDFLAFIDGAELIAHNASFDEKFINHEFSLLKPALKPLNNYCKITDSLVLARQKHPGARASLDALCKRYQVDNSNRELHGALIDADLLAQVYLLMTGGQTGLALGEKTSSGRQAAEAVRKVDGFDLPVLLASEQELSAHAQYLAKLSKKAGRDINW